MGNQVHGDLLEWSGWRLERLQQAKGFLRHHLGLLAQNTLLTEGFDLVVQAWPPKPLLYLSQELTEPKVSPQGCTVELMENLMLQRSSIGRNNQDLTPVD